MIHGSTERYITELAMEYLDSERSAEDPIALLSAADRVKIAVLKWMVLNPSVIVLSNPTGGLDMFAKEEIYHFINGIRAKSKSIVFISSDLDELLQMTNRVILIQGGRVKEEWMNDGNIPSHSIRSSVLSTLIER